MIYKETYQVVKTKKPKVSSPDNGEPGDVNQTRISKSNSINNTKISSSSRIFDRLSKKETFASTDRKRFGEDSTKGYTNTIRESNGIARRRKPSKLTTTSQSSSRSRFYSQTKSSSSYSTNNSTSTKSSSVFDRLSKYETFASADKKGKISRSKMDKTTTVLSPIRQRPVYMAEYSESSISPSNNESKSNNLSPEPSKPTTPRLSAERRSIAELQLRIQASLTSFDISHHSDTTPLRTNKSSCELYKPGASTMIEEINNSDDEQERKIENEHSSLTKKNNDPTLLKLIWNKHFDAAEAFLNDIYKSTKQMQDALCYQNEDGWNSLMRAFYKRPPKYICAPDSLIKDMIEIGGRELVTSTNAWGDNALICAIRNKRSLDLIKLLLEIGGGRDYVLQRNNIGRTPLHWACEMNLSMDVVQCLVEIGGKQLVMIEDDDGNTAQSKSGDVMDYLIRVGGEKTKSVSKRPTILHDLIQEKLFKEAEAYLDDEKVNLYGKRSALAHSNKDGWTPLMFSVLNGAPDSIIEKMIIIGGSEILSMANKWDNIALLYALAHNKSLEIIKLFIERGGGAECVVKAYGNGLTPLHWACKHNASFHVIQYLINEGERLFPYEGRLQMASVKSHYRQVPLHLACINGKDASKDIVNLLLDCDDKGLQVRDNDSKLPLHLGCENKVPFDIIKCLVERDNNHKENLLLGDKNGKIPLHLACENECSSEILLYLAKTGGKMTVDKVPYLIKKGVHRGVLLSEESW